MTISGFDSAQHAHDNAEPDNDDVCEGCEHEECDACHLDCCAGCEKRYYEEDPDDVRDREYAYGDEE